MGKVFLCYRREDSGGYAISIQDRLKRDLGADVLFMDVDSIPLGKNFVKLLNDEVAKCEVLLAVIGQNWLNARDEDGKPRLDNPNDFVRIEIAAALQRDIPVIPILLNGVRIPSADKLPKDLVELSVRNGIDVRHSSFRSDVDRLVQGLQGHLNVRPPPSKTEYREQSAKGTAVEIASSVFGAIAQFKSGPIAAVGAFAGLVAASPFFVLPGDTLNGRTLAEIATFCLFGALAGMLSQRLGVKVAAILAGLPAALFILPIEFSAPLPPKSRNAGDAFLGLLFWTVAVYPFLIGVALVLYRRICKNSPPSRGLSKS
jgi:TIR domain